MAIKLTDKGGNFDPIPAGVHQAVCYGVADIGTQPTNNPLHKPARKIVLLFELPFERADFGERKNAPRGSSVTLTQSLNEKAILRKMLKSWRGRDFTPQEMEGFDPKVLIGQNCQLNIVHEAKGDKTFANITSIMPLGKGMTKQKQENPTLYFSLDEQDLTSVKYPQNMPQWIQKKIAFCEEVMKATGADGGDGQTDWGANDEAARAAHEEEDRKHAEASQSGDTQTYAPPTKAHTPKPSVQEDTSEDVPF